LWDTASRLGLRITASGAKAYIFQARLNGLTIRRTIGDAGAWALDQARAEANRLQTLIDQGIDPRELDREKAERKAEQVAAKQAETIEAETRQRYTLRALCEAYARLLDARGKPKGARDARSAFKVHVFSNPIADKPAREVTALEVAKLVRNVTEAGKTRSAGVVRSYLLAAYTAARKAPLSAELPAELIDYRVEANPVEIVPTIAVARGDRTLSRDELKAYMAKLGDALPDTALRLALLAGGQRMAQLLRAKVSDYDDSTATLRLLDGKGKRKTPREHMLPLAPKAATIVAALVARAVKADPEGTGPRYLFGVPGAERMTHETPGKRLAEICAEMKGEAFNLRDVRRSCETQLAALGVSRDTRAQLLSHGISGVQAAHYDRHSYTDEKRAALVAWEARLKDIEAGKFKLPTTSNVVELRPRAKGAKTRIRRG
jgi:integrase